MARPMTFIVTEMVTSSTVSVQQGASIRRGDQVEASWQGGGWLQWLVDTRLGAEHLMTFVCRVDGGGRLTPHRHPSEEVVYVLEGRGEAWIGGATEPIEAGESVSIPAGIEHAFRNLASWPLRLVGAMAPVINLGEIVAIDPSPRPALTIPRPIREGDVPATLMGERSFRVLHGPQTGCREITQFTGAIPPGRAPLHAHPHEECVYVLSGQGRLWIDNEVAGELSPASAVFIPIGVRHTLENTSSHEVLKVLGAFSPAGSPAAKLPEG